MSMKGSIALVSVFTSFVAAAQASANEPAPAPAPAPPAAPQVSEINGQLVKVGEHNEYYYDYKRWNVSTNPLGWVFGSYGASVSYGLNQNIAVRGDLNFFKPVGTDASGVEVGFGVPIYFRRTYSGVFLEPGVIMRSIHDSGDGYDYNTTVFGPQVLVGWHWTWDSGLNVAIAAGAGRNWSTSDGESDYDNDEIFANGYLRFGYSF